MLRRDRKQEINLHVSDISGFVHFSAVRRAFFQRACNACGAWAMATTVIHIKRSPRISHSVFARCERINSERRIYERAKRETSARCARSYALDLVFAATDRYHISCKIIPRLNVHAIDAKPVGCNWESNKRGISITQSCKVYFAREFQGLTLTRVRRYGDNIGIIITPIPPRTRCLRA